MKINCSTSHTHTTIKSIFSLLNMEEEEKSDDDENLRMNENDKVTMVVVMVMRKKKLSEKIYLLKQIVKTSFLLVRKTCLSYFIYLSSVQFLVPDIYLLNERMRKKPNKND